MRVAFYPMGIILRFDSGLIALTCTCAFIQFLILIDPAFAYSFLLFFVAISCSCVVRLFLNS